MKYSFTKRTFFDDDIEVALLPLILEIYYNLKLRIIISTMEGFLRLTSFITRLLIDIS